MKAPTTRYARSGDVHIAYQVVDGSGGGTHTFVGLPPIISNIDVIWENPTAARFLHRIADLLGRFVQFDKRGQGMSDRDTGVPTIDDRVDDVLAVLDAIGAEKVVLAGISEGGATAAMFAGAYPERVSHLILVGSLAALRPSAGNPLATPELLDQFFDAWATGWGSPESLSLQLAFPIGLAKGQATVEWANRYERQSTSPGGLLAASQWIRAMDVSDVLPLIQAPSLVLHSRDDALVPSSCGRYIAERIPGASFVELVGVDHMPWFGDNEQVLDAIQRFVNGRRYEADADRVLATVLFTDIVDSTRLAATSGDRRWRELLDDHDAIVRRQSEQNGGRVVKSTGDGALVVFDRPGRALAAAAAIRDGVAHLGVDVRAGLHTGEIEVRDEDVGGLAVHLAARVCAVAAGGQVLVSRTVTDLVAGSGHAFSDCGAHELKGVPGHWTLFALEAD